MTRPTTVLEVLRAARAKIRLKRNWCQCSMAKTSRGRDTMPNNPHATQWCAVGDVHSVGGFCAPAAIQALALLQHFGGRIDRVNDNQGHAAVMRLFTKVIRELEEAGR